MSLTMLEAAKYNSGDVLSQAVAEIYTGSSSVLEVLPFQNIQGNALKYNQGAEFPGIGFRCVNASYAPSTGVINPVTDTLVIAGGDLDVDAYIVATMGADQRAVQESMKVQALSASWTNTFFNGDMDLDSAEFDGLQKRAYGDQVISAGATAGGEALSLAKMDELVDQCLNPTHIFMSKEMARKFRAAARDQAVTGGLTWGLNDLGAEVMNYNGIPILTVDLDNLGNKILGFDEEAASGPATATSIYCVSMGDGALVGIQNGGVQVRDLGELEEKPAFRTRVEWYSGLAVYNGRAVARLRDIGDLAIVA